MTTITITDNKTYDIDTGAENDAVTIKGNGNGTIDTGDGADAVLIEGNSIAAISTGSGDDSVTIEGNRDATITTGSGADTVAVDGNGNATINTGDDNDTVNLTGNGDFVVNLGAGDDTLTLNNKGDDSILDLTGGEGNDIFALDDHGAATFNFKFSVLSTTTEETVYFREGDTPNIQNADGQAWANYVNQLDAWRDALIEQYGDDLDTTSGLFDVTATTSTKKTYLTTTYNNLDNSFTFEKEGTIVISTTDGHDKIEGFNAEVDMLNLEGITQQQFNDYFNVDTSTDVNNDGLMDTVITLKSGGTFGIDILGVQLDSAQLARAAGWEIPV